MADPCAESSPSSCSARCDSRPDRHHGSRARDMIADCPSVFEDSEHVDLTTLAPSTPSRHSSRLRTWSGQRTVKRYLWAALLGGSGVAGWPVKASHRSTRTTSYSSAVGGKPVSNLAFTAASWLP
jgi:hypothetical protein